MRVFGVHIVPAERFNPEQPLAGRRIHYWPWPFGSKKKFPHLEELLEMVPLQQQIRSEQYDESVRLLYVGSTRPKDHLIFALRNPSKSGYAKPVDNWLQLLKDSSGTPLIHWPAVEGSCQLSIGTESVPVEISAQIPGGGATGTAQPGGSQTTTRLLHPERQEHNNPQRLPLIITPSHAPEAAVTYQATEIATIGSPIAVQAVRNDADPDSTNLGNAVHAIFAAAPAHRLPGKVAEILRRWDCSVGTGDQIADQIVGAVDALEGFLKDRYGASAFHREWPVSHRMENGQEMRGWIDLLAETPDGWVIVDHKTYRGKDPSSTAAGYGTQLSFYRRAVEQATGRTVRDTLINFVLLGRVFGIV